MEAKKSINSGAKDIFQDIADNPTTALIEIQFEYIRKQDETIRKLTALLNASRLSAVLGQWDKPKNKGGRPPSKLDSEEVLRILEILKRYIKKKNETKFTAKNAAQLIAGAEIALESADDYPDMSHEEIILQWQGKSKTISEKVALQQKSKTWENRFAAAKKSQKLQK